MQGQKQQATMATTHSYGLGREYTQHGSFGNEIFNLQNTVWFVQKNHKSRKIAYLTGKKHLCQLYLKQKINLQVL